MRLTWPSVYSISPGPKGLVELMDPDKSASASDAAKLDREKNLDKYGLFPMYPTGKPLFSTPFSPFTHASDLQPSSSPQTLYLKSTEIPPPFKNISAIPPTAVAQALGMALSRSPLVEQGLMQRSIRLASLLLLGAGQFRGSIG